MNWIFSCALFHFVLFSFSTALDIGECPTKLIQLTETELGGYIHTFDGYEYSEGRLGQIGVVDVQPVAGGYKISCTCAPDTGDSCYLEFDMDYSTNFQSWVNDDGTFDQIQSSQIKCGSKGENILKQYGEAISTYACYSYVHDYDSCDGNGTGMLSITMSELRQYLSTIGEGKTTFLAELGTVELVPGNDGRSLTVTCQCAGDGDACYLDIFGNFASLYNHRTEYSSANKGDGTFDQIKSDPIKCNNNGAYVLTSNSNKNAGMYACYSVATKKSDCSGDGVSSLTDDEIRQFLAEYDHGYSYQYKLVEHGTVDIVPSKDGKSFTMVCQCNATGDMCYFEFSSNINTFLKKDFKENSASKRDDGNYDLITSGQIVCDEQGPYLRGESSWGYTIGSYACYSSLLIPNEEYYGGSSSSYDSSDYSSSSSSSSSSS